MLLSITVNFTRNTQEVQERMNKIYSTVVCKLVSNRSLFGVIIIIQTEWGRE